MTPHIYLRVTITILFLHNLDRNNPFGNPFSQNLTYSSCHGIAGFSSTQKIDVVFCTQIPFLCSHRQRLAIQMHNFKNPFICIHFLQGQVHQLKHLLPCFHLTSVSNFFVVTYFFNHIHTSTYMDHLLKNIFSVHNDVFSIIIHKFMLEKCQFSG